MLWGTSGGLAHELLRLRKVISSQTTIPTLYWILGTIFSLLGGLMTLLVLATVESPSAIAALLIGFGVTSLLGVQGTSTPYADSAPAEPGTAPRESVALSKQLVAAFQWWTADRVRTVLIAAAFVVGLLTYLRR
jgi:hypothetical protein